MAARKPKITRITVSLDARDHSRLSALATRLDVSLSWLTRHAVADFLERQERGDDLQLPLPLSPSGGRPEKSGR